METPDPDTLPLPEPPPAGAPFLFEVEEESEGDSFDEKKVSRLGPRHQRARAALVRRKR